MENENLYLIIVGWCLGIISSLLSTILNDIIKKYRDKNDFKKGLIIEIKQIQKFALSFCVSSTVESNLITEEWSKWVRPYFEKLIDSNEYDYPFKKEELNELLHKSSDEDFYKFLLAMQSNKEMGTTLIAIKFKAPYLDFKINLISFFREEFQLQLFKLKREIDLINGDVEQIWYYHTKTFEAHSDSNRNVVLKNIEIINARIARRSKGLVKLTQAILDQKV